MPSRNAPCPCGSGKKYKRCCGAGESTASKRKLLLGISGGVLLLVAIGFALRGGTDPEVAPPRPMGTQTNTAFPQRQGEPWEYDAATGSHWDPTHGHWHQGPPPAGRAPAPGTVEGQSTPEPWEYDADKDRHWDPNHGHWHDGPPPGR